MKNEEKTNTSGLTARHLIMMALGTVIGGSFFLGSSIAIQSTGPSIILSYIFCGILVYFILFALSEMTVSIPDSGSFRSFASEYISTGTGFVVGWVYWSGMVIAMSSEATAVSLLIQKWFPSVSIQILGSCLIIVVTLLNMLGAKQLSRLESVLAAIKVFAIIAFIILGLLLIFGLLPDTRPLGTAVLRSEPFFAGGIKNLAGSMLIVLFAYAGFEIIGLAASEAKDREKTIPKAIHITVFCLVSLYLLCVLILIFLIPTAGLSEKISPFVTALDQHKITWAGTAMNIILISAILSTMLATIFGIARMLRSLVEDGLGPVFLRDHTEVPYRGILFSGFSMLLSLFIGFIFPKAYLFLISSGGFAILFTYAVMMVTHIRFRKKNGKPESHCRLCGFPYSSLFTLFGLLIAIFSMPFVVGQTSGFFAGILLVAFFCICYLILKSVQYRNFRRHNRYPTINPDNRQFLSEFSEELQVDDKSRKKP